MKKSVLKKAIARIYPLRHLLFYLQRLVLNPNVRMKLADLMAKRLPALPAEHRNGYQQEREALRIDGYVMLPQFASKEEVTEVVAWLEDKPVYDRWNASAGFFSHKTPPDDCHTAPFRSIDIVNCPHLLRWANDPKILSIIGQSLGCKPTLSNLTAWWSYPGHDKPQEAENFHRDVDDLHFIKLFVYLSDVDSDCGPHVFVPGSHRDERLGKIRRYQDSEVISVFGKDGIKYFHGDCGTTFLENTYGLHKGQLPKRKPRLLFQAQYSLHPIGIYEYSPVHRPESPSFSLDAYINRLYVSL